MKKVLISMLMACTLTVSTLSTTGCFGSFGLTKKVHSIGKGINNVIVKEILHLFLTMPVGGFCLAIDWLFLNTFEYWLGVKVVSVDDTHRETDENGNSVTAVRMEDGSLYMRVDAATGETQEFVLQKDEEFVRILDAKGNLLKEAAYAE
jgi:hypothetical protein